MIGIVPARSGSSLKDKNIRNFCGKPLLAWPIAALKDQVAKIFVSTDCRKYADIARTHGALILERPDYLATDQARLIEVYKYHSEELGEARIVGLPPTAPLISRQTIRNMIDRLEKGSLLSVSDAREHPYLMVGSEGFYIPNAIRHPRQVRPQAYYLNGCVKMYDFSKTGTQYHLIPQWESINIDTEFDFLLAEAIYEKMGSQCPRDLSSAGEAR